MTGEEAGSRSIEETYLLTLQASISSLNNGDLRATVADATFPEGQATQTMGEDTLPYEYALETQPPKNPIVVKEHIGRGGLAIVDRAIQNSLNREVAIKRLRDDRISPSNRESLIKEAHLLARLNHPNITPVYELAYDRSNQPILVMKRIQGKPWTQYLGKTPSFASTRDVLRYHVSVLAQLCSAVEYAHSHGILHMDLKTDNVMIGDFGEVYLLDWGVAIEMDENHERLMDTFAGTPRFAAPEMFNPRKPRTPRTDVYLLGGILHEILVLKPLHSGRTIQDIIFEAKVSAPYPYEDDIPQALAKIAHQATSKEPDDRFQSARALRDALEFWLERPHAEQLLKAAKEKLEELEATIASPTKNPFPIYKLAFETRYAFLSVIKATPDSEVANEGLLHALKLLFFFVLGRGQHTEAEAILEDIEARQFEIEVTSSLRDLLEKARLKAIKTGELTTQIQYRLLEQLQKKMT